jgi:hypothetical protein
MNIASGSQPPDRFRTYGFNAPECDRFRIAGRQGRQAAKKENAFYESGCAS